MSQNDGALRLFRPGELGELAPRAFVIGDVIARGDAMLLHGAPISGKSALAVAMSEAVGTGRNFFGHRVCRGIVVYLVGERVAETDRRLQVAIGNDARHLIRFVRARLFGKTNDAARLIASIQALERELGEKCVLIIVDTIVSLLRDGGGDENSQRDVSRLTATIDAVREATGASLVAIHHSKRGERRPKGSEVLEAWADSIASVEPMKGDRRKFAIERSNTTEPGIKAIFVLQPIDLGEDEDTGSRSQVVIAVPANAETSTTKPSGLSKDVELAYVELQRLEPPVSLGEWRSALDGAFASKAAGARRQAISYAKRTLEKEGLIAIDGETISVRNASI